MRRPVITRLSAACVAAAAVTASANASANFFGVIESSNISNGDASDGEFTFINTTVLHSTCNVLTHTFVTHEMWYLTNPGASDWVEVGFRDGETAGVGCVSDLIFWADSRPNGGGYHEHYFSNSWTLGDWFAMQIASDGSCAWSVELGGLNLGASTANCPGTNRILEAGIQASNQGTGSVRGFLDGWEEQNTSEVWSGGWDGVSDPSGLFQSNPPNIEFLSSSETEETHNEPF